MTITVADLLNRPPLSRAQLMAGQDGTHRTVTSMTFMEHPDVRGWLKGGELVLTSGVSLLNESTDQVRLLGDLADAGVAGLIIKLSRFINGLAPEALDLANRMELPILGIPPDWRFVDIINSVLSDVLNSQAAALRYAQEIHQRFTDLAIEQRGLQTIAHDLAHLVRNPVLVVDAVREHAIAMALPERTLFPPDAVIQVRSLLPDAGVHRTSVTIDDKSWVCVVGSVTFEAGTHSYLIVPEIHPLTDWDMIAVRQALTVVTLETIKLKRMQEVERSYRQDFLGDLLSGALTDDAEIHARARLYGLEFSQSLAVVALRLAIHSGGKGSHAMEQQWLKARIIHAAGDLDTNGPGAEVVDRGETLLLLVPAGLRRIGAESFDPKSWVSRMLARASLPPSSQVSVGIGRLCDRPSCIAQSRMEADLALKLGARLFGPAFVASYNDLGSYRVVAAGAGDADPGEVRAFMLECLGPLLNRRDSNLMDTLEVFLKCGGNLKDTAARLFIHASTLRYRLSQLRKVLPIDLADPRERFNLALALQIRKYLGE